jgi:Tfp pilus assembly protein PilF
MLLERGMTQEALAAFQASLAKEPNRFHGYAGAALAAEKLGNTAVAKANYEKLVALVTNQGTTGTQLASADAARPEVVRARQFLEKN